MLLAFALTFTACGNNEQAPATNNEAPATEQTETAETPATEESTEETTEAEEATEEAPAETAEETTASGETTYHSFLSADPESIDAQRGSDVYGNTIVNNIYEPLLRLVQEGDGLKVEEAAAESYEISDDGMTYTFHIRPDMVWEDGEPLTAHNFEYGIKRTVDPNTGSGSAFLLADIENFDKVNSGEADLDELGVKALDDMTLEIKLAHPATYFTSIIPFRTCFPQREDIVEQHGEQFGSEADTVVGCGPFKLTEWTHNSRLVLEKSDTYWDKDKVSLETIDLKVLGDINARMNAFQAKEIMSVSTNLPEWTSVFDQLEGVATAPVENPAMDYIAANHADELFSNLKVRQAFDIAIDREGLNNVAMGGQSTPAYYWVPGAISLNELNYREFAGEPLKEIKEANPDAKALLQEGLDELGTGMKPEDLEIELIMVNDPFLKKIGEYLQQNYQNALGVKINLELMEWPVLSNRVKNGDYQLSYQAWFADYNNPSAMLSLFTSDAEAVNTGWTSDKYDELIKKAAAEQDDDKAAEYYKEAETILMEEAVIFPIVTSKTTMYYQDKVENINTNSFSTAGYKYIKLK